MGDPDPTHSSPAWGLSGCKKAVGGVPCHGSRSLGAGGGDTDRTSNKGAGPVGDQFDRSIVFWKVDLTAVAGAAGHELCSAHPHTLSASQRPARTASSQAEASKQLVSQRTGEATEH